MAKNSSVEESSNKKERIQKFLANMGIGSRRSIEELIRQKKITVNRKPIDLGHMVLGNEIIHIDGRRIYFKNIEKRESRLIIYHKPEGEIVSHSDPKHQKTVFQKLPKVKIGASISIG